MNKLENTTDPAKMDTYYAKIKQYKMSQSGGAIGDGQWRKDLAEQVKQLNEIGKIQTSIEQIIDDHKGDIQNIDTKLQELTSGYKKVEESLEDSLLYLKEVADQIKVGEVDLKILGPIFEAVAKIDIKNYPAIDPTAIWNMINNTTATPDEYKAALEDINRMTDTAARETAINAFIDAHKKQQQ